MRECWYRWVKNLLVFTLITVLLHAWGMGMEFLINTCSDDHIYSSLSAIYGAAFKMLYVILNMVITIPMMLEAFALPCLGISILGYLLYSALYLHEIISQ